MSRQFVQVGSKSISEPASQTPPDTATKPPTAKTTSSYVPKVGDVVSFESTRTGGVQRAIVYQYGGSLASIDNSDFAWWDFVHNLESPRKVGETDVILDGGFDTSKLRLIAKAYFEREKAEFKAGELVEVARAIADGEADWWANSAEGYIGDVFEISEVCSDGNVMVTSNKSKWPACILSPLSGSYAERQAKWVAFHGTKVGSKVKVVRKFEDFEAGCDMSWVDCKLNTPMEILTVDDDSSLELDNGCWYPYFVLEPIK